MKIYLDAGHGGKDVGAVGQGLHEADLTLAIVLRLDKYLRAHYDNVETKLTRSTDIFLSLKQRTDAANAWGANFFLSVHINSNQNENANGFSSYSYIEANDRTRAAQNVIHREIMKKVPEFKDLGQLRADFHVVRESKMDALLTENGFIRNAADAARLKNPDFQQRLAEGHAKGLASFLGLKERGGMDYKGHWAEADIERVKTLGLMKGYDDGSFRPEQPMTRAEVATVILKVLDRKG